MKAAVSWTSFSDLLLDAIYPRRCALCRLFSADPICPACRGEFILEEPSIRFGEEAKGLDYRAVLFRYEGRAGQAVRRLKYGLCTSHARFMATELKGFMGDLKLDADLIVPVPIHWTRGCRRGFNQAELLCEAIGFSPNQLLRIRSTRPQVGLTREQRVENVAGAFAASEGVRGKRVLLVDDVLTTGQTARECASALRAKGAVEVGILAFCGET